MPDYIIESTYRLPVLRVRVFNASSPAAACRAAFDDNDWTPADDATGELHVTGIWEGDDKDHPGSRLLVPSEFDEAAQRRDRHFEILLGLLKILFERAHTAEPPTLNWLARSAWAIARGEAILAGGPDPDEPVDPQRPSHVLALLQEDRVRDAIAAIIEIDPDFSGFPADEITQEDIHSACLETVATLSFSDEIGNAEFRSAMTALQAVRRRLQSE